MKRPASSNHGDTTRKKHKSNEHAPSRRTAEEVQSAQDLSRLLAFRQDANNQLRQNIYSFKIFLDTIAYGEDEADRARKRGFLLGYLESEVPRQDDKDAVFLSHILQTWSYADQLNQEALFSAVSAVLALLLKTISSQIDFREHGNRLSKTLLRKEYIKLFDKGLSASKSKEHIISPCVRLLTEIVLFDGGTAAKSLYLHRDVTFKRLDMFLSMRKVPTGKPADDQRRPSVRNNAVRYLLANLRLQSPAIKAEILGQGRIVHALLDNVRNDPSNMIRDILQSIKQDILHDSEFSRSTKSRILTDRVMGRIATLYSHEEITEVENATNQQPTVRTAAHALLIEICTTTDYGILVAQNKSYCFKPDSRSIEEGVNQVYQRLETSAASEGNNVRQSIGNETLSSFLQGLRPYADPLQSALILAVFEAAPEMVSDYFAKNKSFSFEPKLTATWVGYSAFIFAIINLPIPNVYSQKHVSRAGLPLASVMIESIIPRVLNRKVLTRCLNHNSGLISFFAIRLLLVAFQKLNKLAAILKSPTKTEHDGLNIQNQKAKSTLMKEFVNRCPEIKHIIAAYRKTSTDATMFREAVTRLLLMYYNIIPQTALEEKFDISAALSTALDQTTTIPDPVDPYGGNVHSLELCNLLAIAEKSPDVRWLHRPDKAPYLLCTALLKRHVSNLPDGDTQIRSILLSLILETGLMIRDAAGSSFDVLALSIQESQGWEPSSRLWEFLDDCIVRFLKKPIHYHDMFTALASSLDPSDEDRDGRSISLLQLVLQEQWPFLLKETSQSEVINVAAWISRYLNFSLHIGESKKLLKHVRDRLKEQTKDKECRALISKALKGSDDFIARYKPRQSLTMIPKIEIPRDIRHTEEVSLSENTEVPPPSQPHPEDNSHRGLQRWRTMDMREVIEEDPVGELVLCLCSQHEEIRKQALINLRSFLETLEASGYAEWQQIYLLTGELVDTAKDIIDNDALPYFVGEFSARAFKVLANPLHFLYGEINEFLNKGPPWQVAKLPSYWIDRILSHPPLDDDTHFIQVEWLLDALIGGLRTSNDMDYYRRSRVLEKLLSVYESMLPHPTCWRKTADMLYVCTYVQGSTTLITRCGLLSWIEYRIAMAGPDQVILGRLKARLWQTCDQGRVKHWMSGMRLDIERANLSQLNLE